MFVKWLALWLLAINISEKNAQDITLYENNIEGNGEYNFKFKTSDGTAREESGKFVEGEYYVQGSYEYIDPDGEIHVVQYYADKTGYHTKPPMTVVAVIEAGISPNLLASLLG